MKSFLVIGMGRFGRHLANKLLDLGNDVMIVDRNEMIINEISSRFTEAYIADCTIEANIKSLGVNNFDICFVTIGDNFQSSLEITSLLKEADAQYIISKATTDVQAKFLMKIGANEVIYPEKDMAEKLAIKHNATKIFDYIELTNDYALYEIPVVPTWVNKSILEVDVRKVFHVNIVAIKKGEEIVSSPEPSYIFDDNDHIILIGKQSNVYKLNSKFKK